MCVCGKCQEHDKLFFEQMDLTELLKVWNTLPQPCQPIYTQARTRKHTLTHLNVAQKPIIWDMVIVTFLNWQLIGQTICQHFFKYGRMCEFKDYLEHRLHRLSWSCTFWMSPKKKKKLSNHRGSISLICCLFFYFDLSCIKICTFPYASIYMRLRNWSACACVCVFLVCSGQRRERGLLNINPEVCFEVCGGSWMSPVCVWVRECVCVCLFFYLCVYRVCLFAAYARSFLLMYWWFREVSGAKMDLVQYDGVNW